MQRSRPGPGPLGIVSVLFGTLALLVCWIPLVNALVIPLFVLGAGTGAVGILTALIGRRSAVGWPLSGVVMCVAAYGIAIVTLNFTAGQLKVVADQLKASAEKDRAEAARRAPRPLRPVAAARPG